jgi:hypothetical protein
MSCRAIFSIVASVAALVACARAAAAPGDDTFVQVGHWSFEYPPYDVIGELRCTPVKFPKEFAGVPEVVFVNSSESTFVAVSRYENITAQGFTPVLYRGGYRGVKHGGTVSGDYIAVGPGVFRVTAVAKYLVLAVVYSPPGTNGGKGASSVNYEAGSSAGTTTSAIRSFKTATAHALETSGSVSGRGAGSAVSFEFSKSSADSQWLELKKSKAVTLTQAGPARDGINHDLDEVWLLLKPTIQLAVSSSSASWTLADKASFVEHVQVGWLNGHEPMPAEVAAALKSAGITPADYPEILARNPLAADATLDPTRLVSLNTTLPYEPPPGPNDPVPAVTFLVSTSTGCTLGPWVEDTYKVGLTLSATRSFLDSARAALKDTASWMWTNQAQPARAGAGSQSASLTLGGPSFGYQGDTVLEIYYDTLYKTFAFGLVPISDQEIAIDGTLQDAAGKPLPRAEVTLLANGTKHRTFTNAKGEYKFFGAINGPAKVSAGNMSRSIPQAANTIRHVSPIRQP